MKKKCYSNYLIIVYSFFSILDSIIAIVIWINISDDLLPKLFFCGFMILCSIIFLIVALYYRQYYQIIGNNIILSNSFGKMEVIDLNKAVYEVLDLPSYSSWTSYIYLKWICIYEKDHIKQFKQGFDNKKNKHRIQIAYSSDILQELESRKVKSLSKLEYIFKTKK